MPTRSTQARGVLVTGTGAIVLSSEGVLVSLLHVSQWTILLWRGPLMAIGFTAIFSVGWAGAGGLASGLRAVGGWGLLAAALFASDNLLFIVALRTTSVANTLVILSTAPVWAAVLGRLLLGEPVGPRTWVVMVTVVAGVAVIFRGSLGHGQLAGDLAALGAAISIAGTLVVIRRARAVVMLPSIALGALLAALVAAPLADPGSVRGRDALLLILLGLMIAPGAFACISIGPRYLPAHEVSLLMLLETVLGPVWAWLVLGQVPPAGTLAGGAVIVVALVANSVLAVRRAPASTYGAFAGREPLYNSEHGRYDVTSTSADQELPMTKPADRGPDEHPASIGRSPANVDGVALVTGRAKYTADIVLSGMAYGRIVHSPIGHARIVSVDPTAARKVEGVLEVVVPDDFRDLPYVSTGPILDMPLLAQGTVRYAGEPVAAVIATSQEVADAAAELVDVTYEPLPVVLDPEQAMEQDAPLVHEDAEHGVGNVCWRQDTKVGDIDRAFREADLILRRRFQTSKQHAMPMETHGALAAWDEVDGSLTVWSSTQHPHVLRATISKVFGISTARVRVVKPFVGGAFGHKVGLKAHEAVAVFASRRLRRPVRVALTRWEEFAATVSRNPQTRDVTVALRADGEVLGWRERIVQDVGAYSGLAPSVLCLSEWVTVGPYRTPALDIEGVCVYTNKPPSSAFRGFGNPQATFARELMFDIAARELGLDPVEFRRRNVIRAAELPTRTANGLRLETLPIERTLSTAMEAIGYDDLQAGKKPFQGVGVVNMLEWGGGCRWLGDFDSDMSSVTLTMHPDGSVLISSDAADSGQGHATVFTQIATDVLGVTPDAVRVILGDTAVAPYGLGTYASRTAVIHGTALQRACLEIRTRLLEVAAHQLEADSADLEVTEGTIRIRGTSRSVSVGEVASAIHSSRGVLPAGMETGALSITASYDAPCEVPDERGYGNFAANYTCSTTVAFVEVDPASGKIAILDWASAEDVGRVLHPEFLDGQLQGGIAQGIGYAVGEELLFDSSGAMLNPSMVDYQVPTAPTLPLFGRDKLVAVEGHDPTHPLGHKGVGESGMTPAAAAIACAVYDAIGVPITTLPLSPERVYRAAEARLEGAPTSQRR